MSNPAKVLPDAAEAIQSLVKAALRAGVPQSTFGLSHLSDLPDQLPRLARAAARPADPKDRRHHSFHRLNATGHQPPARRLSGAATALFHRLNATGRQPVGSAAPPPLFSTGSTPPAQRHRPPARRLSGPVRAS